MENEYSTPETEPVQEQKPGFLKRTWLTLKKHKKKSIAGLIVIILLWLLIAGLKKPKEPEYLTEEATRGDLVQVVEAVGEIISERDLKLQFPITGVIQTVLVDEGDVVEAGQELAKLRSSGLSADVKSAQAQVAAARAEVNKLVEGTRPEEIVIAQTQVYNKRASLQAARESLKTAERDLRKSEDKLFILRNETRTSLEGFVRTAKSDISQHTSTALTSAQALDGVFEDLDLLDAMIKHEPHEYRRALGNIDAAQNKIRSVTGRSSLIIDYRDAISHLEDARDAVADVSIVLNEVYGLVSSLEITPSFSSSDREDSKTAVAKERTNIQLALSALDTSIKNLRDASASFDTKIAAEEASVAATLGKKDRAVADIQTFQTSLRMEEANLSLKQAGSRPTDIAAARAQLNQAYAQLQRAEERFADTIIVAPINGTITQVNLKEGELLSTSFASEGAITMLGTTPYRIEMFVSEIDIPKVAVSQTGAVSLDAFPDQDFLLNVTEVDPAATEVDGVSKYRVKLDFSNQNERLKIGMTGDAEVYTDFREDVVIVPGRAVVRNDKGQEIVRILQEDGQVEERRVEVGMDGDGGNVEVVGVKEGEVVVVLIKD